MNSILSELATSPKIAVVTCEMWRQSREPPSGDRVIATMWQVVLNSMVTHPALAEKLTGYINQQPIKTTPQDTAGYPVSEVAGKIRAVMQYHATNYTRERHGRRFPYNFDHPDRWRRVVNYIASDFERLVDTETILNHLPVNTTSRRRYAPFEVGRQLLAACTGGGDPIAWYDGGSSVRVGANSIHLKDRFPPARVRFFHRSGRAAADGTDELVPDPKTEALYDCWQRGPRIPGETLCVDMFHPRDRKIRALAIAALRPVSEIGDRKAYREFKTLMDRRLPEVHFEQGDITDTKDMLGIRYKYPALRLRQGFLGTVLCQIGQAKANAALELGFDMLEDNGTLWVADFATPDPNNPARLLLAPTWDEWSYNLLAAPKSDRKFEHILSFRTSRCEEAMLGTGRVEGPAGFAPLRAHLRLPAPT